MNNTLKAGPITQDELIRGLMKAKKVMNKVDAGDYHKGNIDESLLISDDVSIIPDIDEKLKPSLPNRELDENRIDRIRHSKLPDVIKESMIKNPIPEISLGENNISMDIVKNAKRLMEKENINQRSVPTTRPLQQGKPISDTDLVRTLTPIIENIIRKTIDEILDRKIEQILNVQKTSTINENLVLKVGNSIFNGKITGVKKVK